MINFSGTENISNLIELEKVSLMSTLDIQKSFNKQILVFMKKFMANIDFSLDIEPTNKAFFYLNEATSSLNKSNSNINTLTSLLDSLSQINLSNENWKDIIKDYNENFKLSMNSVYENTKIIEKFVHEVTITDLCELPASCVTSIASIDTIAPDVSIDVNEKEQHSTSIVNTPVEAPASSQLPENTLVISETQKKVILPYNISKVEDIMKKNKRYHSVEEVVSKLYTKPINYYKFSSISRFKEAYKLIKEKEKGSTFKALSLAFELLGNYSLHPAIITACKSLDELDIYLACLEENDLDDFKFFDIKYEVPMAISKFAKNNV